MWVATPLSYDQQIEPPRLLVFTWIRGGEDEPTESTVRFDLDESDGATTVRVTHSGLVTETLRARNNAWPLILSLLQDYVQQHARAAL